VRRASDDPRDDADVSLNGTSLRANGDLLTLDTSAPKVWRRKKRRRR
jgi:hypothetical protein